ncbi:MFS transporter [Streptomyces sp. NPDC093089]|uniref:MFS transporter n=1 Tax=Streptomyces sp. NPDC093089 TaxID=3366024 RepID=UPI0037FA7D11
MSAPVSAPPAVRVAGMWPLYAAGFTTTAFGAHGIAANLGGFSDDAVTSLLVLGGLLVWAGGLRLLFTVLAVLGAAVAVRAVVAVPAVPPLPKRRQTVLDLARRLADPVFLGPTAALAAATAALSVGVGFLPVSGAAAGLGTIATGAAVSVLAATAAVVQPYAGRAHDAGRLTTRTGLAVGLAVTAAGLGCAMLPGLAGVLLAAALIGTGTGLITPLGFTALATSTPEERMGQTMGAAELGRELGDAGGPLLVAGAATLATLTHGYAALALLVAAGAAVALLRRAAVSAS